MDKYRIMLIDDDEDARKLIAMTLQQHFEVVEANDGLDALSKLETYEPEMFERLRTWWIPDQHQINLELLTRAIKLEKKDLFSFRYSFEFLDEAPN